MDLDLLTAIEMEHRTSLQAQSGIERELLRKSLPQQPSGADAVAMALRGLADRIDGRRSVTISTSYLA